LHVLASCQEWQKVVLLKDESDLSTHFDQFFQTGIVQLMIQDVQFPVANFS
jgi:hypothetical protein